MGLTEEDEVICKHEMGESQLFAMRVKFKIRFLASLFKEPR